MKKKRKLFVVLALTAAVVLLGVGVGSVGITPADMGRILIARLTGGPLDARVNPVYSGLVLDIRLPRVVLAFLVGAALAVSGTVMQSVLKNPLASSYGLGVSAGAGLGAALVMVLGLGAGVLGMVMLPMVSLAFGLATVVFAISFASRLDRSLSNHTIILTGMVLSLFLSAIMSTIAAVSPEYTQRIMLWQLGSFSMKGWSCVAVLLPVVVVCTLFFQWHARELDVMTFGEEQAGALGVDLKKTKWLLIGVVAALTSTAVAFVGVIGFVDLIAPHIVRRFFGSSHRYVIPVSALFGGGFMVACDLAARTLASPAEIPIGSITALLGAPFFIYIYFTGGKRGRGC